LIPKPSQLRASVVTAINVINKEANAPMAIFQPRFTGVTLLRRPAKVKKALT